MDLDKILRMLRQFKCSDPKDRIFGILALIGEEKIRQISPNYNWTMAKLYSKVTQAIIEGRICLRAICIAGINKNGLTNDSLPCWVADWRASFRDPELPYRFKYKLCRSSPKTGRAIFSFEQDSPILKLAGICVDTISDRMEITVP